MKTRNWIYVTGVPRSGTTFVGKMLSIPIDVNYLHEPFNPRCGLPEIDRPYLYLGRDRDCPTRYVRSIENLFADNFRLKTGYFKEDSLWRSYLKSMVGSSSAWSVRLTRLNPIHNTWVIKDPIGCLLTEYLADKYDIRPVIIIRHPVAVVASVLRLGWQMSPDQACDQPELIRDYFARDKYLMRFRKSSGIEGAAALWSVLNTVILRQVERNHTWIVVTHEDICRQPLGVFEKLYLRLGLKWSDRAQKKIQKYTGHKNPLAAGKTAVHSLRRDSIGLLEHSLKQLSRSERQVIYDITRPVADRFYARETFDLGV